MNDTKKNAPSTAATGIGAKIIKLQVKDTTTPAKRQEPGKIIPFQRCPDGIKLLYRELSKSELGRAFIKAVILLGQVKEREV